ncbi:ribonuclease HII [Tamlana fucoidanivorans]|uniref:Ribonuclease HII n=1 Tax=Allotamlana fucoidanivorans TaxID=2583814 RepID=A0A5C4SG61_9FLAO|nr:ribonuclease HII [Tamlana fucoidanivorans]TNJ42601.1 ribonuclease HII [Tamlana fucoidanivorans]
MRLFYFPLLLVLFLGCTNLETKRSTLLDFVPEQAEIIIKTSNIEALKGSIHNSDFLQNISKTKTYNALQQKIENLSFLNPEGDVLICLSKQKNDSIDFAIITRFTKNLLKTDSLPDYKEESVTIKNTPITKLMVKDQMFYSAVIDSVFFVSTSKETVLNNFSSTKRDLDFIKVYHATGENSTCSVILKPNQQFLESVFIEDSLNLNTFTKYMAFDAELSQDQIYFNGITQANDSTHIINIFRNTVPQENQIQHITPSNSDGFVSFTFDNFKTLEQNLATFNSKDSITTATALFNDITEVGVIYEDNNQAIVLNSTDVIATQDALLAEQNKIDTYREIDFFEFDNSNLFSETFAPLINFNAINMYCQIDHFFVFTNRKDLLQNIIANFQNKTTLAETQHFKTAKAKLSDAASFLQVVNTSTLQNILNKNIDEKQHISLKGYNASAIQFIYDHSFAHVNGVIGKNKSRALVNSVTEQLNIKLDTDVLNTPQFVKNHITMQKEIVVQDVNNQLYLISNEGKILWKKKLRGPVLGNIEQIDMYKNGRLQLAFATPNRIYVLDRNGKDVSPFPLKFNDAITQPLSVFDYDKKKKYRLLVTQGKHVLMYDVKGKVVKGFTFKSADNTILSQPQHFRIGSKDYIAFKTKNNLYILNRVGKTRVKPKQSHTYSDQPIFLYNNTFTTTDSNGDIIAVDTKGNVSKRSLNLSDNHSLTTTSKTLVTQSENKLTIKNKTTDLDFGGYSTPKIFYINDKIYVTTTDLQAHKVYLFDSQSKIIANFPVYGNSIIDLDNIDRDINLEFVTKGESNSIILYQIN